MKIFAFLTLFVLSSFAMEPAPAPAPVPKAGFRDGRDAWILGGFHNDFRVIQVRTRPDQNAPWGEWEDHSFYANQFRLDDALMALVEESCDKGTSNVVEYREGPDFAPQFLLVAVK